MNHYIDCSYEIEGKGPPLFLIHGIGAAKNAWRFMSPILKKKFKLITYDLRGHGESPIPENKFNLDDLVRDLEALRKKLNVEKAHFAGHSLGGMIAPSYAKKFPERVLSLGLISTAAGRSKEDKKKVFSVIKLMEEKGIENVLKNLTNRWFTDTFIKKNPDIIQERLNQVINTNPKIFLNVFRIYAQTEMRPWLREINKPSLILTGENDGGCNPRLNKIISSEIKNSKLIILPNYKHSLLTEAPNEVSKNLIDFIVSLKNENNRL